MAGANSIDTYTNPYEYQVHMAVVEWLSQHQIVFLATLNEGRHKAQYRRKQKAMGLAKGVPDLLIFDPPPAYPDCIGTAIELKRAKGGVVSPEQADWIDKLKSRGWYAAICRGQDQALQLLEELGYGQRRAG